MRDIETLWVTLKDQLEVSSAAVALAEFTKREL